jgi:hypothetical protein
MALAVLVLAVLVLAVLVRLETLLHQRPTATPSYQSPR